MKAREAIAFMGALRGLDWSEGRRRAATFMAELGLEHVIDAKIRKRSEEHTSELQSLMRISYAVFCLNNKKHRSSQEAPSVSTGLRRSRAPRAATRATSTAHRCDESGPHGR